MNIYLGVFNQNKWAIAPVQLASLLEVKRDPFSNLPIKLMVILRLIASNHNQNVN